MCPFPSSPESRRRLLDAQRAETDALKAVEMAARAHDRIRTRLETAVSELNAAKVVLVECSGLARAALLLAEDEANLRRACRAAARSKASASPDNIHSRRNDAGSDSEPQPLH